MSYHIISLSLQPNPEIPKSIPLQWYKKMRVTSPLYLVRDYKFRPSRHLLAVMIKTTSDITDS